jgi:hypothetical protein
MRQWRKWCDGFDWRGVARFRQPTTSCPDDGSDCQRTQLWGTGRRRLRPMRYKRGDERMINGLGREGRHGSRGWRLIC